MNAVDTNVLVYTKDPRDPRKQAIAKTLVATMPDGILLWQVTCEFLAASRKREPFGYSLREACEDIEELGGTCPNWRALGGACPRLQTAQRYSISFWDALLLSACCRRGLSDSIPRISIPTTGSTGWKSSIRFGTPDRQPRRP